jgi:hypothetical protein
LIEYDSIESAKEAIAKFDNTDVGNGEKMHVQYVKKRYLGFRKDGLRLGQRRTYNQSQYYNQNQSGGNGNDYGRNRQDNQRNFNYKRNDYGYYRRNDQ